MDKVADFLTVGIMLVNEDLTILSFNKWLCIHTGIKEEEACGKRLPVLFDYISEATLKRKVKTALSMNTNTFYNPPNGHFIKIKNERVMESLLEYAYQSVKIVPFDTAKKEALLIIEDHTAIKEAYSKLEDLKDKAEFYLDTIDKNVYTLTTDDHGIITDISAAMCRVSGYKKEELIGLRSSALKHPDTSPNVYKYLWSTISSGGTWKGELRNSAKNGKEYWVRSTIFPVLEKNGKTIYKAILEDITDKKKIEKISITDELTGLFNRRHFNKTFPIELQRCTVEKKSFIFVMLDVDHFKKYNDTYGHLKGDEVLSSIGKTLDRMVHGIGYAFRLGGEEFGLIATGIDLANVGKFAENIRASIEALGIEHKNNTASLFVTASIGLCTVDFEKKQDEIDAKEIYAKADEALYASKEFGRNRFTIDTGIGKHCASAT
jgi:diguanylate cyclase (GGDEF)-like protein/PAS domain S-box-containing protein